MVGGERRYSTQDAIDVIIADSREQVTRLFFTCNQSATLVEIVVLLEPTMRQMIQYPSSYALQDNFVQILACQKCACRIIPQSPILVPLTGEEDDAWEEEAVTGDESSIVHSDEHKLSSYII